MSTVFQSRHFQIEQAGNKDVTLKSSLIRGHKNLKSKLKKVAYNAPFKAVEDAVDLYVNRYVAKDTGNMRNAVREALFEQIIRQRGKTRITLSQTKTIQGAINKVPYTEHHVNVGPTGNPTYEHPTTLGTEPIKFDKLIGVYKLVLPNRIKQEMRKEGFQGVK